MYQNMLYTARQFFTICLAWVVGTQTFIKKTPHETIIAGESVGSAGSGGSALGIAMLPCYHAYYSLLIPAVLLAMYFEFARMFRDTGSPVGDCMLFEAEVSDAYGFLSEPSRARMFVIEVAASAAAGVAVAVPWTAFVKSRLRSGEYYKKHVIRLAVTLLVIQVSVHALVASVWDARGHAGAILASSPCLFAATGGAGGDPYAFM